MSRYSEARAAPILIIHRSISDSPSICTLIDKKQVIKMIEIFYSLWQEMYFLENLQQALSLPAFWNDTIIYTKN